MPADRPLRDVLREVETCGLTHSRDQLTSAQRLARELRALAPLLRELTSIGNHSDDLDADDLETLSRASAISDELEARHE